MARRWKREGKPIGMIVRPHLRATAHYATDKATMLAKEKTRSRIQGVGLGRLANAVGATSSARRPGYRGTDNAWGAVFARGPTEGRGNQALMAYSEGASIFPTGNRKWLAFATNAIPKRAGRYKMTPKRYMASGLVSSIGKLQFVRGKGGRVAYLVARNVLQSKRTGRIKAPTGRKSRTATLQKSVIAFILIRYTRRAQRWSQAQIMLEAQKAIPHFAEEFMALKAAA